MDLRFWLGCLLLLVDLACAQTFTGCFQRPVAFPPGMAQVPTNDYIPCIAACRAARSVGCAFTYGLPLIGNAAGTPQCFTIANLPVALNGGAGIQCRQQCDVAANSNCARTVAFVSVFRMDYTITPTANLNIPTQLPATVQSIAVRASPKNAGIIESSHPDPAFTSTSLQPPPSSPQSNTVAIGVSVTVLGLAIAFVAGFAVYYTRRNPGGNSRFNNARNQQAMINLMDTLSLRRPGSRARKHDEEEHSNAPQMQSIQPDPNLTMQSTSTDQSQPMGSSSQTTLIAPPPVFGGNRFQQQLDSSFSYSPVASPAHLPQQHQAPYIANPFSDPQSSAGLPPSQLDEDFRKHRESVALGLGIHR